VPLVEPAKLHSSLLYAREVGETGAVRLDRDLGPRTDLLLHQVPNELSEASLNVLDSEAVWDIQREDGVFKRRRDGSLKPHPAARRVDFLR